MYVPRTNSKKTKCCCDCVSLSQVARRKRPVLAAILILRGSKVRVACLARKDARQSVEDFADRQAAVIGVFFPIRCACLPRCRGVGHARYD